MEWIIGWVFFAFIIFFVIILSIGQLSEIKKKKQEVNNQIAKWMENNNFKISSEISYPSIEYAVYLDEISRRMLVANFNRKSQLVINFDAIIGAEIVEDGISTNAVGRAIVGGVLLGGVGAIVGSNTGKKMVKKIKIVIYINRISNPKIEIILDHSSRISTDSRTYEEEMDFARTMDATIRAIIDQNGRSSKVI